MSDQPTVRIWQGENSVGTFELKPEGVTTFGRASKGPQQPDITLPGEEVSRRQCHVVARDGVFVIFDGWPGNQPSTNGTQADGQLVSSDADRGQRLGDGSLVVVPARAKRTAQITLEFEGIVLKDEETRPVDESDLDDSTAHIGDEGAEGAMGDDPTQTQQRKAWVKVLNGPGKADVVGLILDARIEPRRLALRGKRYALESNKVEVGRGADADIVIADPDHSSMRFISRRHAVLRYREEEAAYVLVNHSPNGTNVSGETVYTETELKSGDRISIGNIVLGFHYDQPAKSPWYVRHPWITRSAIVGGVLAAIVALGALGYVKLMNRIPDVVMQHTQWVASGVRGPVYSTPALADLNGDDYVDAVVGQLDGTVVAVDGKSGGQLWNRPPKAESAGREIDNIRGPLVTADLDGDGRDEVLIPSRGLMVAVNGTGGEVWSKEVPDGRGFLGGVAVADLDGNGVLDVVTADGGDNGSALVLRGENGAEMFQLDNPLSSVPPALADMNRDGTRDIILACRGDGSVDGQVIVYDGRTGQRIWGQPVYKGGLSGGAAGAPVSAPAVADLNGDGVPEVVVVTPDYMVLELDGSSGTELGRFAMEGTMFLPTAVAQEPAMGAPVIADMNRDGHPDVIVPHLGAGAGGNNFLYALDGTDISRKIWTFATGEQVALCPPALADLNRDGIPEVFLELTPFPGEGSFGNTSALEIVDGAQGIRMLRVAGPNGQGRTTPLVADMNRDGQFGVLLTSTAGTATDLGLNVPTELGAVAWGVQRGTIEQTGAFRVVPHTSERLLLAIGVGALVVALLMGLLSGIFALLIARWRRRKAYVRELAGF